MTKALLYTPAETALIEKLVEHFPEYLIMNVVKSGDMEAIVKAMKDGDQNYGCYLDFGGGTRPDNESFAGRFWVWSVLGVFLIKFTGDTQAIETKLRAIIDRFATLFLDDPRLGGAVAKADLVRLERPEPVRLLETAFYWAPFQVDLWVQKT